MRFRRTAIVRVHAAPYIPREDDKGKNLAWTNLPTVISAVAVFFTGWIAIVTGYAFTLSCAFVAGLDDVLPFSTDKDRVRATIGCRPRRPLQSNRRN